MVQIIFIIWPARLYKPHYDVYYLASPNSLEKAVPCFGEICRGNRVYEKNRGTGRVMEIYKGKKVNLPLDGPGTVKEVFSNGFAKVLFKRDRNNYHFRSLESLGGQVNGILSPASSNKGQRMVADRTDSVKTQIAIGDEGSSILLTPRVRLL